jgi:hypothetical protein
MALRCGVCVRRSAAAVVALDVYVQDIATLVVRVTGELDASDADAHGFLRGSLDWTKKVTIRPGLSEKSTTTLSRPAIEDVLAIEALPFWDWVRPPPVRPCDGLKDHVDVVEEHRAPLRQVLVAALVEDDLAAIRIGRTCDRLLGHAA